MHTQIGNWTWSPCNEGSVSCSETTKPLHKLYATWRMACHIWAALYTVEPPFNVHQFKVFCHVTFNFSDSNSVIALLNLRFSSLYSSYPLLSKEILNGDFTVLLWFHLVTSALWGHRSPEHWLRVWGVPATLWHNLRVLHAKPSTVECSLHCQAQFQTLPAAGIVAWSPGFLSELPHGGAVPLLLSGSPLEQCDV
jgi:hypothetical protein